MAKSIEFTGINRIYSAPLEEGDEIPACDPMFAFNNGAISMTRWKLSDEELAEINRTGEVWLAVRSGRRPMQPHWLGSMSDMKRKCLDFAGGIWFRWPVKRPNGPPNSDLVHSE